MPGATVEIDFLGLEKQSRPVPSMFPPPPEKRSPIRGIQNAISRINPQLLKAVMTAGYPVTVERSGARPPSENSACGPQSPYSNTVSPPPPPSEGSRWPLPSLPVLSPASRCAAVVAAENHTETSPVTMFYNGTVSVFDLPRDKVEALLKMAAETGRNAERLAVAERPRPADNSFAYRRRQPLFLDKLDCKDLPLARQISLQRFLEKRKERLRAVAPYSNSTSSYSYGSHTKKGRERRR